MAYRRVYLLILDGLGVGSAPDAALYGDVGSDTLLHVLAATSLHPTALERLGLGNLYPQGAPGLEHTPSATAHYGRLTEVSAGKDTTTGHWELTGVIRTQPAPTFPKGFPAGFIDAFSKRTGRGVLGNKTASGTEIIQELGEQHLASGDLIVYTSADSVFQIAAHVDIVPTSQLYDYCRAARDMLRGDLAVDRVIARPFTGSIQTGFSRTPGRRDYALPPPEPTILDELSSSGYDVLGIGKISDIFAGRGLTGSIHVHGNRQLMEEVTELAGHRQQRPTAHATDWRGLVLCNLVDFDMLFGHRNNPEGYGKALVEFDDWLAGFIEALTEEELLIITADHGNDPTTPSTDHSREQVPLLITSPRIARAGGHRITPPPGFHHVGKTVIEALGATSKRPGQDLLAGLGS